MDIPKFPVLDWSSASWENLKLGSSLRNSTSKAIRQALEDYSFFEVVLNKPCVEFVKEIYSASKELFELPPEIKKKNVHTKPGLGYSPMGPYLPESFGIVDVTDIEACTNSANLMWPQGNDRFRKIVHSYAEIALEVEKLVIRMLFESYGLEEKYYEEHVKLTTYHLRLLKYEKTTFKAHMDKTFLTIVHQNHINGLEIRDKSGKWISYIPSSPSSFVILAGDLCMAWSNDRIKSAYHRVSVSEKGERFSMAFFTFMKGVIKAPKELVDEDHPLQYKPFEIDGLLQFYMSNMKNPSVRDWNIVKVYCDEVLK